MIFLVFVILIYMTIYIVKGKGLWENIELYTPNWSEKILIIVFFYLFVFLATLSWWYNHTQLKNSLLINLNRTIFILILVLFSFSLFCLSDGNSSIEEAFILSSIVFGLLIVNMLISFMFNNTSSKLFSLLPLSLYTYIYAWMYEIKNNY
jgi:hypothetical protein